MKKGFTLVELLVVIAIVAILAGALMLVINPTALMQKGRDARRLDDMDNLTKAINLALADGEMTLGVLGPFNSVTGTRLLDGTGYVRYTIPTGKTGLSKFIPTLPVDPLNTTTGGNYQYVFQSTASNFELNCVLEHPDNATKMSADGGNAAAVYEIGTSLTVI